jgi:hypothetical protein
LRRVNGAPIQHLETSGKKKLNVTSEDALYYAIVRQLADTASSLAGILAGVTGNPRPLEAIEYIATTFTWGYTGSTADLVVYFSIAGRRAAALVIEVKRETVFDAEMMQLALYADRIAQVGNLMDAFLLRRDERRPFDVFSILVAPAVKTPRHGNATLAVPKTYCYAKKVLRHLELDLTVHMPAVVGYTMPATSPYHHPDGFEADEVAFSRITGPRIGVVDWVPPRGTVGTDAEKQWLASTSWKASRSRAGI